MGFRRRTRRRALVAGAAVAHHGERRARRNSRLTISRLPRSRRLPDQEQAAYAPPPADPADELEHLAQLHESGVLTDEEFAAAKAKTLGT